MILLIPVFSHFPILNTIGQHFLYTCFRSCVKLHYNDGFCLTKPMVLQTFKFVSTLERLGDGFDLPTQTQRMYYKDQILLYMFLTLWQ